MCHPLVNSNFENRKIDELKKNGCDVKYTEYPGVGHGCWFQAYKTPGLADWLFAQKKK